MLSTTTLSCLCPPAGPFKELELVSRRLNLGVRPSLWYGPQLEFLTAVRPVRVRNVEGMFEPVGGFRTLCIGSAILPPDSAISVQVVSEKTARLVDEAVTEIVSDSIMGHPLSIEHRRHAYQILRNLAQTLTWPVGAKSKRFLTSEQLRGLLDLDRDQVKYPRQRQSHYTLALHSSSDD